MIAPKSPIGVQIINSTKTATITTKSKTPTVMYRIVEVNILDDVTVYYYVVELSINDGATVSTLVTPFIQVEFTLTWPILAIFVFSYPQSDKIS